MLTVLTGSPEEAAEFVRRGGVAAFPTETVYGLGADIFNERAIEKIFQAKGRPADNPLIVHIGDLAQINQLVSDVTPAAEKFIVEFFPGPLTLVLPRAEKVPLAATAGLGTVGVRMPGNRSGQEFLRFCETPVAAPSANLSGRPSPTTWQAVFEDLDGRIDCILQGEETEVGLESTVVDCTGEFPAVLRAGAITMEQLQAVVPGTIFAANGSSGVPKSPGLKHKHYAPRAIVTLVENSEEISAAPDKAYIGMAPLPDSEQMGLVKFCASVTEYAHSVFEFFRECDRRGIETIYCEKVVPEGLGAALMDRLERAGQRW